MDYSPLDVFLRVETWHTLDPNDLNRFYSGLAEVVDHADFDPQAMAEYMTDYHGIDPLKDSDRLDAVRHLQEAAYHIRDFLRVGREGLDI